MSFGHFWLTQLPDVRTIHSSRCTLIWAAGTSKFTLGLAFHNLPMGLSAWFNNGGIISSTFTYFYDEVWLMKIDEVWWNMRTFLDVVSCLQSQDTSKKYQKKWTFFLGKKRFFGCHQWWAWYQNHSSHWMRLHHLKQASLLLLLSTRRQTQRGTVSISLCLWHLQNHAHPNMIYNIIIRYNHI